MNPKVSKGPEETTGGNKLVSDKMNYVRVFPCCEVTSFKKLRVYPLLPFAGGRLAGAHGIGGHGIEVGFGQFGRLLDRFLD